MNCYNYFEAIIQRSAKKREINAMINYTSNVKIISSFHKSSKPYGKIENRLTHGFIFRIHGCAEYFVGGKRFYANEGDVVFLPKGSSYEYRTIGNVDNLYTSINFEADFKNPSFAIYPGKDFYGINYIKESFSELFKFGTESDKFKSLSLFYDFLAYILRLEHQTYEEKNKYSLIEPAIAYLKKHLFEPDFKLEKLHSLCGISNTYFRKIFISRFDVCPSEYVLRERITHAKSMLESGDFDSIKEVALSAGYSDPLYFSKVFKKFYGFSPSSLNE